MNNNNNTKKIKQLKENLQMSIIWLRSETLSKMEMKEKWVKTEINGSGVDKEKIQNMDQSDGLAIIKEAKTETFSSCSNFSEG